MPKGALADMEMRSLKLLAAAFLLAATAACELFDDLDDHLKTCEDTPVVLVNSEQTRVGVNIIGPDEVFSHENFLESGHERRISMCLEEGDKKRFRVREGEVVVESKECQSTRDLYEIDLPRVTWYRQGIVCENW
jgi:hypothetical protein